MSEAVAGGAAAAVLGAVLMLIGLVAKRKAKAPTAPDPIDTLLRAFGYDPNKVHIVPVRGRQPGIRIVTRDGRPLRFVSLKELRRKKRDQRFMNAWWAAREGKSA